MTTQSFALSPGQRRLALVCAEDQRHTARAEIDVDGPLDVTRLERALTRLVETHEILRTSIEESPDSKGPRQVVRPPGRAPLAVMDDPENLDAKGAGDPFTAALVRRGRNRSVLVLSGSSLCLDAPSLDLLHHRIASLYGSADGASSEAPSLQYADVAEWENDLAQSEDGKPGRDFWRGLRWPEGFATVLPFERETQLGRALATATLRCALGPDESECLDRLTRSAGATREAVLLACWYVLLWRFANRAPIVLDVASSGRGYDALVDGIGPYSRDLPLHVPLAPTTTFTALLDELGSTLARAREWEQLFDWDLVAPRLSGAHGKAMPSYGFEYGVVPRDETADGIAFSMVDRTQGLRGHSIMVSVHERPTELQLVTLYDGRRFDRDYIASMMRSLRAVLISAARDPGTPINELSLLDAEDWRRLIVEPNDTARDYPRDRLIHEFMERQASRHPERTAVEFRGESLSYGELDARANRLAHHLMKSGVGPDTLVAIFADRSFEMVVAAFGVLKAGGGYVPLSPSYPPERLAFILDQTRAPVLITTGALAASLPEHPAKVVRLDGDWPEIARQPSTAPERTTTPDNVAYVIYTSGSTGEPKGVVVTHRTFVISNEARIEVYGDSVKKFLLLSPFAFDSSIVGIFWTLSVGGTLSLVDEETQRDLPALCRHIEDRRVSHLLTLPSFYDVLLSHGEAKRLEGLGTVIVAGEACRKPMVERHKLNLPRTGLYSEYGATETTIWSSAYDCLQQTIDTAPLGRPISNCEMYILDADLQPLPVGVPGEVHFGGAILAKGYWNRPDLTAERFIRSPFRVDPGARLYRSGDLARILPNGDMEFLGRVDNQVKIRGFRVELEEIEVALAAHPDLLEVAVAARDASEWVGSAGDGVVAAGSKRLVGYVCPRRAPGPSAAELRDFLGRRIPSYMVPVAFITLERLPKTPNGKLDRAVLPRIDSSAVEQPAPTDEAPTSPTEATLADIWKKVLGVAHVGRHDNFFELGGDSILSIQVVALANKSGLGISPRDVFEQQTIAGIAAKAGPGQAIDAEQGPVSGEAPLHPIQHWLLEQNRPDPHHANLSAMLQVEESLEPEAMRRVVARLLQHHDALRLRFERTTRGWRQWHGDAAPTDAFSVVDFSDLLGERQTEAIEAHARATQRSLNLEAGDLLRVVHYRLGDGVPGRLLIVVHHLVFDGVSLRILLEDLQDGYRQVAAGEEVRLPPKTTSYKAWNERLVDIARSQDILRELGHWCGVVPTGSWQLPDDVAGGAASTYADQAVVTRRLTTHATNRLLRDAPNAYRSRVDEVLLAALVQSMCAWTGHPGLFLELEGHGREPMVDGLDASRTIGWFTTVYPAYLMLEASAPPATALQSIMAQLRAIPGKGAGYGVLRYLGDEATRSALAVLPRPRVNFNYLGQFDQVLGRGGMFRPATEHAGPDFSERSVRPHALEVVGSVVDGRLRMDWMFGRTVHASAVIERIADDFIGRLTTLVDHCVGSAAGGVTATDREDFAWDASDVEEIAAAVQRLRGGR